MELHPLSTSGYLVTWAVTLFDLPTITAKQRKAATEFRESLLNDGYIRLQLSVYQRWFPDLSQAQRVAEAIGERVPEGGVVDTLFLTEKQYKRIVTHHGTSQQKRRQINQLELF